MKKIKTNHNPTIKKQNYTNTLKYIHIYTILIK